jgi:acetoin utilization protein AcuC
MSGTGAFIYHPIYEDRGLSPFPSVWQRYSLTKDLLEKLGVIPDRVPVVEPEVADENRLSLVHSREYIDFVRKKSEEGRGFLDYGDTPAYPGVFKRATASAGGSVKAAELIGKGECSHVFNPGGGLHHARFDSAGGFCVFNDVALAVRVLTSEFGFGRVAVIDIDGHHADGTQEYFFDEQILTISLHRFDPLFYPGSGSVDELGRGEGYGYTVNLPLPARTSGDLFLEAFESIVPPVIRWYRPEVILLQCGVDGHYQDPLVRMYLTTHTYETIARSMHDIAHEESEGKLLLMGGGGYSPENVARCWAIMFATITGGVGEDKKSIYDSIHDGEIRNPSSDISQTVKRNVDSLRGKLTEIHGKIF